MSESEIRKEIKKSELKRGKIRIRPDEEQLERMTY